MNGANSRVETKELNMSVDWNTAVKIASEELQQHNNKVKPQSNNLSVEERDSVIVDLKNRIRRLEEDMAHILVNK